MDADAIVQGWQSRLTALADRPAYVFRDTPRDLINQHYRRLTTFAGYDEAEVAAAEADLRLSFPAVFRAYLRRMGRSRGDLFCGSEVAAIGEFSQFRRWALDLLAKTDPSLSLPSKAVVFMSHQGYTFLYLECTGGFDSPAMQWLERAPLPKEIAIGFRQMVEAELSLMERTTAEFRKRGGYYLTLHRGGGQTQEFPALANGDRPLDHTPADSPIESTDEP